MASKKVKNSPSQKTVKKPAPKKKSSDRKAGKLKKKKVYDGSHNPVKPISPVPPLPDKDLEDMEKSRSQFNGSPGDEKSNKKQAKLEKQAKSRKASLIEAVGSIFDKHKSLCDRVSSLVGSIDSIVSQAAELDGIMKHSDLRPYNIHRRLSFDSLVKDLRVASTRLGKISANSGTLNKVHRDLVSEDIQSAKPAFE